MVSSKLIIVIYSDSRTNLYSAECYDRYVQYCQYEEGDMYEDANNSTNLMEEHTHRSSCVSNQSPLLFKIK